MEWFEDAFFLFTVRIFDASLARANANPKKIYCVDHALVRSVGSGVLVNAGHLLENLVFTALRRRTPDIRYFKDRSGREVDFVAQMPDGGRALIQVCESLVDPKTRKREVAALNQAMSVLGFAGGHDRDPRRGGDGPGRCRPHRRRSCMAFSPRPRVTRWSARRNDADDLTCTKRRAAAGAFTAQTTQFSLGGLPDPTCATHSEIFENSEATSEFSNKRSSAPAACVNSKPRPRALRSPPLLGPRQPYPVDAGITVLPITEVVDLPRRFAGL